MLPCHTSRAIADHVNLILKEFFPDPKKLYVTSCHDGAANMIKTSKHLKVNSFQHCASHGLHLLLTTDSINTLEDVMDIIRKCREIVSSLHFKTLLMEDEMAATNDKLLIEDIQQKFADVNNIPDLDDQYLVSIEDTDGEKHKTSKVTNHISLKQACQTRWNSTLYMVESIVQLKREMQNALKRCGHLQICLFEDEFEFLEQLIGFLNLSKTSRICLVSRSQICQ